jgi:hypothetical protein
MSAHAAAIEALTGRIREFLRTPTSRLLHVVASTSLRKSVLATVMAAEHAPDNPSPFVAFSQPHGAESPGWIARTLAARQQHDARRKDADPPIAELPPPPPGDDARVVFAQQLWQLLEARPPGSEGLVVVLAPTSVQAPKNWAESVGLLVGGRQLRDVRWIVIDVEGSTVSPVVAGLGARAIQHDARVPEGAAEAALGDMIAGDHGAKPKGVVPPPRPDVVDGPLPPDAERQLAIGRKVMSAALAMGSGRATEAIGDQRQARDLCTEAGWTSEALQMELMLGGQLMAAGQGRAAEESFGRAIDGAREAKLDGKVATAGFALGAARAARREPHTALVAWAEAALAAERSGDPMLAIEGNRLAGRAAADLKMEPQAITFYSRAVKLAESTPPERLSSSTASEAASGLAKICRKRGLRSRAIELEAQAKLFATPVEPAEPEPEMEIEPEPVAVPEPEPIAVAKPAPPPPVDPAAFLGPLPVPPEQLHNLPEHSVLLRRDPQMPAFVPPPEGTVLLDDLHPASIAAAAAARPPVDGTILLDDLPEGAAAAPPPPVDFGEGTGLMTLDEIAEMHWGGQAPAADPAQPAPRRWTQGEIEILQRAVNDALEPEATLMLSLEELAALRGEKVERPPEPPRPAPVAAAGTIGDVDGLEPAAPSPAPTRPAESIPGLEAIPGLEPLPASEAAAPRPTTFDADEVTTLTRDDIARMRDAMRRAKDDEEDKP